MMTFDQTIQIINTTGIWLAAIATFTVAGISLHLSRRAEKVKLKAFIGIRLLIGDGISSDKGEHIRLGITNRGQRAVVVDSISWSIGKGKNKEHSISPTWQQSNELFTNPRLPIRLPYGERADFTILLKQGNWINVFAKSFCAQHDLKTLRCHIGTSVGETIQITPEKPLLKMLAEASATKSVNNKST